MSEMLEGRSRFYYWIPAILVAILITLFSTGYFSDEQTGRIILPALHWLFPGSSRRMLHLLHLGIRKLAHVVEFGVFSATVFRGVRAGRTGWRFSWALATLVIAAACAGLDEWHQSFVPLRQAAPRDVAIDTFGALFAQSLVWWYATRKWPFAALAQNKTRAAKEPIRQAD
jgi:VanZ family protein